jgi:hypothetical protein
VPALLADRRSGFDLAHFIRTCWQCKRIFDLFSGQGIELFLNLNQCRFLMLGQWPVLHH